MINNNKYIGVFDSGVGGLTLVKNLIQVMPQENIIYLADYKHMPYGDKTSKQIINYVLDDVKFLNSFDLKAIIIACNTADVIASDCIRERYDIPVYGVVDSTALKAVETTRNNIIGVIATTATINSNEYEKHIKKYNNDITVISKACPFLVPLIEEGKYDIGNEEIRIILKDYLSELIEANIDTLVLGCTHYDLLKDIIADMYPKLNIVSSSRCIVDTIAQKIKPNNNTNIDRQYYVSDNKEKFIKASSIFMPDIEVNLI